MIILTKISGTKQNVSTFLYWATQNNKRTKTAFNSITNDLQTYSAFTWSWWGERNIMFVAIVLLLVFLVFLFSSSLTEDLRIKKWNCPIFNFSTEWKINKNHDLARPLHSLNHSLTLLLSHTRAREFFKEIRDEE